MRRRLVSLAAASALTAGIVAVFYSPTRVLANAPTRAASGQLRAARIDTGHGVRVLPTLSGGVVDTAASLSGGSSQASGAAQAPAHGGRGSAPNNVSTGGLGCGQRNAGGEGFGNVRVNQDCTYRLQAEEGITVNPANPRNLVAGMNDERQGYNLGAFAYSFDSGKTWGDGPPPFYQKINDPSRELPTTADPNSHTITGQAGNGFTYDGGSDPIVAMDREGRAYFGLVIFDRDLGNGSAVAVTQSPIGAGGSFYYTPDTFSRNFIAVEDNDFTVAHDKPFIAVDINATGPNRDNVYVTWTVFRFDSNGNFLQSPIYGSMSTDHALTWSTPEQISGSSSTLCFFGNLFDHSLPADSCNFDQGSDPKVLPNGDLEVIFNNGNTPPGNPNGQQLGVHCRPTGSSPAGTAHLNCGAPAKVGDDILTGEPQCNFGRGPEECIPGSFVRTNDFPRVAVDQGNGTLYATWQDFRNGEFDIQLSRSTDGGATWTTASQPVNPDRGIDHYEAAIDVVCQAKSGHGDPACPQGDSGAGNSIGNGSASSNAAQGQNGAELCADAIAGAPVNRGHHSSGGEVAISYYRTCTIPNEAKACPLGGSTACALGQPGVQAENSDYSLLGGLGFDTPYKGHAVSPVFSPPNGGRDTGFMGDYSGLTLVGSTAHPIWADPRNNVPVGFQEPQLDQRALNDEDIFTAAVPVPGIGGQ